MVQGKEWFSFSSPYVDTEGLFNDRLGDSIRIYAFARKLKEFSIDLFNLDPRLVFGSDKDKNTKTELLWKDMPTDTKKKGKMSITAIQKAGGYVVGLTRHSISDDTHDSEVGVEKCLELCDAIIDNEELTIPEQNEQIYNTTKHLDIFPEMG